jgi:hypothetical protein
MGYSIYILSKDKEITKDDYQTALSNLSKFNKIGLAGRMPCDIELKGKYIFLGGSFSISGSYAEGFVLNLVMCLLDLNYRPTVISRDWDYGTEDDWQWLEEYCKNLKKEK